jgi:hypothetical protein
MDALTSFLQTYERPITGVVLLVASILGMALIVWDCELKARRPPTRGT